MGILINLLSDASPDKINIRKSLRVPYSIERSMEQVENYALYKYALQKAQRYPRHWIENHLKASVLLHLSVENSLPRIRSINIISKSDDLNEIEVKNEVYKTLHLASKDMPFARKRINISVQLNWI